MDNNMIKGLVNFLKQEFTRLNNRLDVSNTFKPFYGKKVFSGLIALDVDFGSGNDLNHNTKTGVVYRGKKYHTYKDALVEALDDIQEKVKAVFDPEDELMVSIVFYQTNLKQNKRSTKDLDNMEKPTLDAMQIVFGFDDAQIVEKHSYKRTNFQRAISIEIWK